MTSFGRMRLSSRWLVFAAGFVLLFISIKSPANLYDEGLSLLNTTRIMAGEVPYRDFWTLYAPGYFYVQAGVFKLSGVNMLVSRVADTVLRFALALIAYRLGRRLASPKAALVPFALVAFWLGAIRFYSYPAFPALAALLLAVWVFMRYTDTRNRGWLLLTGITVGMTAALRLDFGGYLAAGLAVGTAVFECSQTLRLRKASEPLFARSVPVMAGILCAGGLLLAGFVLVALPFYGLLAVAAGLPVLWDDLIIFPATIFRAARHLPVPALVPDFARYSLEQWEDWVRLYLPLSFLAAGIIVAVRRLWSGPRPAQIGPGSEGPAGHQPDRVALAAWLLTLAVAGLGLVVKGTSRYHELHILPATIVAVLIATALLYRLPRRIWRHPAFVPFVATAALLLTVMPYFFHFARLMGIVTVNTPLGCYARLERAACVPVSHDQEQAVEFIRSHTQPGESVFVGNAQHDKVFANDMLFNFLADRPSPTRYTELHPGLANTLPVQQAIAADLLAHNVEWVVIFRAWDSREPNTSSQSTGVTYLDEFIRQHYRLETTFGAYVIRRRI